MNTERLLKNFSNVGWTKMNVLDLINLCKTNSTMKTICDDPATWKYLIKRDFGLDIEDEQPKQVYIRRLIYGLGIKYNELANISVTVVNNIENDPNHFLKNQKDIYINNIIENQQRALGAIGFENNPYHPKNNSNVMSLTSLHSLRSLRSHNFPLQESLIEGIKVGQSFYNAFLEFADNLDNPTVFEILDEMEFRVDDAIDFIKSNILLI